jgi:hypothetical protein
MKKLCKILENLIRNDSRLLFGFINEELWNKKGIAVDWIKPFGPSL